ncbi:uncharacterized protein LOC127282139 [Leptopilina boulardi]|uniref:uncharacterized protein LOC127282139 n=1 Tax=Leptopilina boulardi TaxID=63433 RepID=UPI0021F60D4D|nr:uncharacterized protein LOC127282139 [Leptopilina boulardi]
MEFETQPMKLPQVKRFDEKHRLIKLGKEEIEQSLNTTFKPIVTPIQKLADEFEIIKHIRPQKIKVKNEQDFKQENIIDPSFKNSYASSEIKNEQDDEMSFKTASFDDSIAQDDLTTLNSSTNKKKKDLDNTYGVRKLAKGRLMIGDSPINFEENNIIINNSVYHATKGLLELLFKKTPQENFISFDDRENYANIVISTNAHKKIIETTANAIYDVIEALKTDNNVRISTLEDTATRFFENLKSHIERNIELLSMKETISILDSRLQALEKNQPL